LNVNIIIISGGG